MADKTSCHVAVVGCGPWGRNLVRNFASLGVLAAVVDVVPTRMEQLAKEHNVQARHWASVLGDSAITSVALATPAEQHVAMAIEALAAKKHVFVEKPLALSVHDGKRIAAAAVEAGRLVMVGHLLQFHPAFLKLKAAVQDGELGNIQYVYSHRLSFGRIRKEENALWSFASHDVSAILGLAGETPAVIESHGCAALRPHVVDTATAHLRFPSGMRAHIFVSWLNPTKEQKMVVVGDEGMAVFDDGEPWDRKLLLYRHKVSWRNEVPETNKGCAVLIELEPSEPLADECKHFVECVRSNSPPRTDVHEGLAVLSVLSAAEKAMDQNKTPDKRKKIQETAVVDEECSIGQNTSIWHFSHVLKGSRIGADCTVGQNVVIGPDVAVGSRCKIQNNVMLVKGVSLEDGVFCGPSCVFTNVLTPRAEVDRKYEFLTTTVRRGATIGGNATLVCGNELGEYCMVGAGAVVTKPVPPYALVVGNPARRVGWVSASGERLGVDLVCPRTGQRYHEESKDRLIPITVAATKPDIPFVPLVDLQKQRVRIHNDVDSRISRVLEEGRYIMGPEVKELEQELSAYTGAPYVISCASGTDALTLALMALDIQPGDAVLVPTFTFVATAEVIARLNAAPVFVDIDAESFNINPGLIAAGVEAARAANYKPVGIVAVDLFGQPADYDALCEAAAVHNLWVVADSAQSFGASIDGRRVGRLAKITTTSFFPSKPLGCYGDGGAVMTEDARLAEKMRSLRSHGQSENKYENMRVGLNSRLDTIQAAVLLAKLDVFPGELEERGRVALRYDRLLAAFATTPVVRPGCISAWAQYTVRTRQRDFLKARLQASGIQTAVHYPRALHCQPAYNKFPVALGGCPVAEEAAREVLSLPFYPYMDSGTQDRVVQAIQSAMSEEVIG